jgi:hypothetical protein
MRTDNTSSFARRAPGTGTSSPEVYTAHDPSDATAEKSVFPGQSMYLKSTATGKYCRTASLEAAGVRRTINPAQADCTGTIGLLCDQSQPVAATLLTFTGTGFTVNGVPLVEAADGFMVLSNSSDCHPAGIGAGFEFPVTAIGEEELS